MKRSLVVLALILFCAVMLAPSMSSALGLEIAGGYGAQSPSGDIAYKPLFSGDKLDIEKDLNYEEEYRIFGRIKADMPLFLPNVYLFATPIEFEETGSKDGDFKFGDTIFSGSVPFESRTKIDQYDVCLYYSLPLLEEATLGKFNAEVGLNARIIDFEAEVSGRDAVSGLEVTESYSTVVAVPMIYAGIQINPVDFISIEAEGRGIAYSSNHYYDLIGRIKIKPFSPFFIAGGYRYNDLKVDYSDVEASIKLGGAFLEGGIDF